MIYVSPIEASAKERRIGRWRAAGRQGDADARAAECFERPGVLRSPASRRSSGWAESAGAAGAAMLAGDHDPHSSAIRRAGRDTPECSASRILDCLIYLRGTSGSAGAPSW